MKPRLSPNFSAIVGPERRSSVMRFASEHSYPETKVGLKDAHFTLTQTELFALTAFNKSLMRLVSVSPVNKPAVHVTDTSPQIRHKSSRM